MPATRTNNSGFLNKELSLEELEIILEINNIVISNIALDEILQSVHS